MKRMTMTMGALAAAAITGLADAGIIFYTDEAAFNQALADAGKISKGIEDFEQAILPPPPNNFSFLNDPLNINNLQGFFPSFIDNLTFQSNLDGPGVNGPNPEGVSGLQLRGAGFGGTANVALVSAGEFSSFDILSGPPAGGNHTALGMHVVTFTGGPPVPVEVRVFDKNEQQLGLISLPTNSNGTFLGILATGGETIGRVNIFTRGDFFEGIYDVQTYLIPAPGALALLGLAGLVGPRRRRR